MTNFLETDSFSEEMDGQLTLFETKDTPSMSYFINTIRAKIRFMKNGIEKDTFENLEKEFNEFISLFLKHYDSWSLEKTLLFQEKYSSEYHELCKLFLKYFEMFIFSEGIATKLNDESILKLEIFIMNDDVRFNQVYYKELKNKILNRKKLRGNPQYIIFRWKNFLEKLEQEGKALEIKNILKNYSLEEIFCNVDEELSELDKIDILCILLMFILNNCAYNKNSKLSITKEEVTFMENFILYNLSDKIMLNIEQSEIFEQVLKNVSNRLKDYIIERISEITKHLHDYDELEAFKSSNKYKIIEENDDLDYLPNVYYIEEIKQEMEIFLIDAFMLEKNIKKSKVPIFLPDMIYERHQAMCIGLEYLKRFIYKDNINIEGTVFEILENYIAGDSSFMVRNPSLCSTKSELLSRVDKRNVHAWANQSRKLLKD